MTDNSQENHLGSDHLPKTYLDLIIKVGGKGKYQYILTIIISFAWYVTGIVLMSTAFIFLNPTFDCEAFGLLTNESCFDYVCSLPPNRWPQFVTEEQNNFKSLANSFGQYYCQDEFYLNLYSSCPYFGALIGYMAVTFYSDNYGRKKAVIIAWSICTMGCFLLMLAPQLWVAGLGLFFCGMGSDSVLCITCSIMVQLYDDQMRQKHSTIVQGAFTIGALFVTLVYYIWQDWKITVIYALFIPSALLLIAFIYFTIESPMFLARDGVEVAVRQLNKIGKINSGNQQILTIKDVQNVMHCQQAQLYQQKTTPLDVFKYKSLRTIIILQGLVSMATFLMYYGPSLIVDQFGFNIYISNTILNFSDLLTYYPLMMIINSIKRKKACIILFGGATLISSVLIFLNTPKQCENCYILYIQLGLIFIFRFFISMQFALKNIYQSQLFPTRIRNTASGVLGVFGTVTSTTAPLIMGAMKRASINYFILFTALGIMATGCYTLGPQTYQKLCPEEIEQIEFDKHKRSMKKTQAQKIKLHKY